MRLLKTGLCVVLMACIGLAAGGCGTDPLVSAGLKVANNQISQLTGAEIKALSDAAMALINSQGGQTGQPLTDAQAAAVANFLLVNGINTPEDMERVSQQAEADPTSLQGLDELAAAFNVDPNDPDPYVVRHVFEQLFGLPPVEGEGA
ncbi:MAG TPA: hypothetical protein VMV94_14610 [Phycisphaerae bacterium]|nr:hypothetical protein [Phycisphaerae bacterium]